VNRAFLQASGISVQRNGRLTLHPTDFAVRAGETVGIYGPNGGKSTLLLALAGLLPLTSGAITIGGQVLGQDLTSLAYPRRSSRSRFSSAARSPTTSAWDLRFEGLARPNVTRESNRCWNNSRSRILPIAPSVCSPGEGPSARAWRGALVLDPEILFLDEPFAALDQPTRRRLVREFAELLRARRNGDGVCHPRSDRASVLRDRCAVLDAGAILQDGPSTQVFERPRTRRVAEIVDAEGIWDAEAHGR
jgi:ABC-type Fe3+/spermidine/putrescine transport system ATPase subunit